MAAESIVREPTQMSLRELRLRPGMFLQTQPAGKTNGRGEAQFCAAIAGRGIMVVPLGNDPMPMKPGERHVISGFTGMYDFVFEAPVLQLFTYPFAYTLLGYPTEVRAVRVRNALRMKIKLKAIATLQRARSAASDVTLVDLSPAGAMASSPEPIGTVGDIVTLAFALEFEGKPVDLSLNASICHSTRIDDGDGYRTGFAFKDTSRNDRLVLEYFALKAIEEESLD